MRLTYAPLNPPNAPKTEIKLVHLTELRTAVNQLRVRAGLAAVTNWNPDPNPQQYVTPVHHDHITQLRTKLEEALNALHLPEGTYAHSGPSYLDTIYAIDFQELRQKIKDAWTALANSSLSQSYDGDGLRVKKTESGATTFYLRSSVLGGQVLAELDGSGNLQRGYVYAGSNLMAVQQGGGVFWTYEDPVTKSKRVCDVNGNIVSTVELDPWGADTNRSAAAAFQPRKYTTYDRDANGSDEAMFRRYNRKHSRFDQPDPYHGSYDLTDPQSFDRYAYVQNDPANFVDPTGLELCWDVVNKVWFECGDVDPNDVVHVYTSSWRDLPYLLNPGLFFLIEQTGETGKGTAGESTGGGSHPLLRQIKQKICGLIPSGRTVGVSGAVGLLGAPTGGGEVVINYNSGQVSAFAFGGAQFGLNGVASAQASTGFVWGLNDSNSNYAGGFNGWNGGGKVGGFWQWAPGVNVVGASVGRSLIFPVSGGRSATQYTKPLQLGKWGAALSSLSPLDGPFFAARQLCK